MSLGWGKCPEQIKVFVFQGIHIHLRSFHSKTHTACLLFSPNAAPPNGHHQSKAIECRLNPLHSANTHHLYTHRQALTDTLQLLWYKLSMAGIHSNPVATGQCTHRAGQIRFILQVVSLRSLAATGHACMQVHKSWQVRPKARGKHVNNMLLLWDCLCQA